MSKSPLLILNQITHLKFSIMMFLGIIAFIIGLILLFKTKKHEMENTTDGGVVKHKSVMSGFGQHMLKVLGTLLVVGGVITAIFSWLGANYG